MDGFIQRQTIDLGQSNPVLVREQPIVKDDAQALIWVVTIRKNGVLVDLAGAEASLYCARSASGSESESGTTFSGATVGSDGTVTATLPTDAANIPGPVGCMIRVTRDGASVAVARMAVMAVDLTGNNIIDVGKRVPNLDEVVAAVLRCEKAADKAEAAASKIDTMTVTATGLDAGAAPTAELTEVDGRYNLALGVPKGDKGDTGETGPQGPQGEPGKDAPQEAVLYTAQELDDAQKAQARANVSAADAESVNRLKDDIGGLLHHPKEYWTMGDINVPITGEWSNKQVKCEVDLSDMVGNVLKVSVGNISDSIDTHYCYINLLDEKENNISDGYIRENTFIKGVIPTSGGYTSFDISSIRNSVKYIKVQAQAYREIKPTITGTIKYSGISAKDDSDKIAFIAEVNKSNLSNNLKNELHLSDSNGAVIKNVGTVNPNTTVTITSNNIKKNKTLIVNAKINSFEKITVGHGIDVYGGAYLEVTPSELNVYNYSTQAKLVKTVSHSLTIANDIYIEVTNSVSKYGFHARIKIVSQGKSFVQSGTFDFPWTGSNGDVFIKTGTNTALSDCKVSWSCSDLSANIHAFGDSYFDYWNPKMADLGYSDRFLFDGFGGRTTLQAIAPLNFSLQHGTPKYVLWCLGMNNPDVDTVNPDWLNGFNSVIAACESKDITPIFTTIPNTPKNNNSYKNAYIKSSGYRYVDIAHYVGADEANSNWYDGLLSSDNVHPTDKGAYIIAQNIIIDLADIIFGN